MGEGREMTYGEKAVGLTFNPSGDPKVQKLKELYAEIIDICSSLHDEARARRDGYELARLSEIAVKEAQGAQMWAVKAVTWKD